MYSDSSPCWETRPCQKPQPYQELLQPCQELVKHIQMCARRAHCPNMQLYNLFSSREVNIHTILLIYLIKPYTRLQYPISIPSSSFHEVIIKLLLHVMSLAKYIAITICYHITTLKLAKRYLTYTNHFSNSSLSQLL